MNDILHRAQLFHIALYFVLFHYISSFGLQAKYISYLKISQSLLYITIFSIEKGIYHDF